MPLADPESSEPTPLRPRVNPPAPTPTPAPPGLSDLLLLARALMRDGNGGEAAPGQARGPLPKEQKKFYKVSATPPAAATPVAVPAVPPEGEPAPGGVPSVEISPEAEASPAAPPPPSAEAEHTTRRPERGLGPFEERTGGRRRSASRGSRGLWLGVWTAVGAGLFLAGLLLGKMARPAAPVVPSKASAVGERTQAPSGTPVPTTTLAVRAMAPDDALRRAMATIDEASAAHRAENWVREGALLEQADREAGPNGVPGLTFRRAENAVRRGDLRGAKSFAETSLSLGEDVARSFALRAVIAQRSRAPKIAQSLLEAAICADPFEGRYPFYESQALRSMGKLQEAAAYLRRALDRVDDPGQRDTYRLTLRLTQTELGEDGAFAEELARRLAQPDPSPDWLVTAAARECQAGRTKEAADYLRRAFAKTGPGYATQWLGDVFFRRYADRPEMVPLFSQYVPLPELPPSPPPDASPPGDLGRGPAALAPVFPAPPISSDGLPSPSPETGGGKQP